MPSQTLEHLAKADHFALLGNRYGAPAQRALHIYSPTSLNAWSIGQVTRIIRGFAFGCSPFAVLNSCSAEQLQCDRPYVRSCAAELRARETKIKLFLYSS
jgi:hypothetical protein